MSVRGVGGIPTSGYLTLSEMAELRQKTAKQLNMIDRATTKAQIDTETGKLLGIVKDSSNPESTSSLVETMMEDRSHKSPNIKIAYDTFKTSLKGLKIGAVVEEALTMGRSGEEALEDASGFLGGAKALASRGVLQGVAKGAGAVAKPAIMVVDVVLVAKDPSAKGVAGLAGKMSGTVYGAELGGQIGVAGAALFLMPELSPATGLIGSAVGGIVGSLVGEKGMKKGVDMASRAYDSHLFNAEKGSKESFIADKGILAYNAYVDGKMKALEVHMNFALATGDIRGAMRFFDRAVSLGTLKESINANDPVALQSRQRQAEKAISNNPAVAVEG